MIHCPCRTCGTKAQHHCDRSGACDRNKASIRSAVHHWLGFPCQFSEITALATTTALGTEIALVPRSGAVPYPGGHSRQHPCLEHDRSASSANRALRSSARNLRLSHANCQSWPVHPKPTGPRPKPAVGARVPHRELRCQIWVSSGDQSGPSSWSASCHMQTYTGGPVTDPSNHRLPGATHVVPDGGLCPGFAEQRSLNYGCSESRRRKTNLRCANLHVNAQRRTLGRS